MPRIIYSLLVWFIPSATFAQEAAQTTQVTADRAGTVGVSAFWVLANISYAGMRAQNNPAKFWRIVSFLAGLPGTIITYFAVKEGTERAYGIDIPGKIH